MIGHLDPNAAPPRSNSEKSSGAITDDFSKRVPSGPIVEPAALREAARTPTTARSTLHPVKFTLSNGITVLVQQKTDRATFTLSGSIASSAAFVPPGKEGVSQLASMLADYGSDGQSFEQRRTAIDLMGASVENGQDFSARGVVTDFAKIIAILADGEEHPSFAEPWFSLERESAREQLAVAEHDLGRHD